MKREVDRVTLATVWGAMRQACYDMRFLVERTAQNYLITELHDLSVGIWDAEGKTLSVPIGIAMHFLGTSFVVKSVLEKFKGNLKPGDVILTNDPYHGGHTNHLPDWGFLMPIFYKGDLVFWTLVRGHQQDSGGAYPGGYFPNGYDIHSEGLVIPPTKVIEAGRERADLWDLIMHNVRFPQGMKIDTAAMIASLKLGERRMVALLAKYGKETVLACADEMIAKTEKAVKEELKKIPEGIAYTGEAWIDDDGTELDVPVPVRVTLTRKGDELVIDLTDNVAQRKGFINQCFATSYGIAVGAVVLILDPALAELHNEGTMRAIKVIAPPGTMMNPQYPATVGGGPAAVGATLMEAILQALSKALPERSVAGAGRQRVDNIFGVDPRKGKKYMSVSFNKVGCMGAVYGYDGYQTILIYGRGAMTRGSVEEEEVRYPWRYLKWECATDLQGAGKWRGGPGIHLEAVNEGEESGIATGASDGDEMVVKGLLGGHSNPVSRTLVRRNGQEIRVKSHRMFPSQKGDVLVKLSSGGAGVGDPRERDRAKVREDVRNGYVSLEAARRVYGLKD